MDAFPSGTSTFFNSRSPLCCELFHFLQYSLQLHQPCRVVISCGEELAVLIAGNFSKTILVIKEDCLIIIVQDASSASKRSAKCLSTSFRGDGTRFWMRFIVSSVLLMPT